MDEIQPRSVADRYADLIDRLPPDRRRGFISRLANGYYEGWRPPRPEVEDLVALELGQMSFDQYKERQRQRRRGIITAQPTPTRDNDRS